MIVTIMWTAEAAEAHGRETEYTGVSAVEEHPDELKLHTDGNSPPTVVDRDYVVAYNRYEPDA
jgi:hypothetical protein